MELKMSLKAKAIGKIAALLKGYAHPWWVAGGWAVDMHLGYQSRYHEDLEIAIPRNDQHLIRRFLGEKLRWEYFHQQQGHIWGGTMTLSLPIHEVQVDVTRYGKLEILLNDFSDDHWIYRRDPCIRLDRSSFDVRVPAPLPCPVLLLYKSKHQRPKDNDDYNRLLPAMTGQERAWLRMALEITAPSHPWLIYLSASA